MQFFKKILNYKLLLLAILLFITGCDNANHTALNYVYRVLESNDYDVNRELGVYILGSRGTIQKVHSATCSIEEKDNYGRYILLCSINYSTSGATNAGSAEGSVYVGYLNTGGKNFSYKIGATNYSNSSGIDAMKNDICWNSNSKSMDCTVNDSYKQNSYTNKEKNSTITDNEEINYTGEDYLSKNKIGINEYVSKYSSSEYSAILLGRPTCNYCVAVMPILNKIISEYNIDIYYLDFDSLSDEDIKTFVFIDDKHEELAFPTLEIVGNNSIKAQNEGQKTSENYISFLKKNKIIN